ncbi:zinc ribbon-containing protein [Thiomicrorhabdus aquaedulcis]|uniref:zinc ribbon-containing protein n=1 Tax=Thiomicrorhabdus aquaedulcis TaxID=2211106 RepID=UPI000FD927C7|nr:hypothetical protein [Thiomicrorhabdus aquaedulcis]
MAQNKMLVAYRTLLNHALKTAISLETKTWSVLGHTIEKTQKAEHALAELTEHEFKQVQQDLQADLMQTAEYFAEVEKGVEEFLEIELPVLEQILIDKAMKLADPTDITLLRLRFAAALDEQHPTFDHKIH